MKDIRTMIDKVIGKKGRLRVPAYWMNTLLDKIVELVESVRKELTSLINKNTQAFEDSKAIHWLTTYSAFYSETVEWAPNRAYFAPFPIKYIILRRRDGAYTIYTFLDSESKMYVSDALYGETHTYDVIADSDASRHFGFYKIDVRMIGTFVFSTLTQVSYYNQAARIVYNRPNFDSGKLATLRSAGTDATSAFYMDGERVDYRDFKAINNRSHFPVIFIGFLRNFDFTDCYVESVEFAEFEDSSIYVWPNQFADNKVLKSFDFRFVSGIGEEAFRGCTALEHVELGNIRVDARAFFGCTNLQYVIIRNEDPSTFDAFTNTNMCPIYVPNASVNAYKNRWPDMAARIRPLSEFT